MLLRRLKKRATCFVTLLSQFFAQTLGGVAVSKEKKRSKIENEKKILSHATYMTKKKIHNGHTESHVCLQSRQKKNTNMIEIISAEFVRVLEGKDLCVCVCFEFFPMFVLM